MGNFYKLQKKLEGNSLKIVLNKLIYTNGELSQCDTFDLLQEYMISALIAHKDIISKNIELLKEFKDGYIRVLPLHSDSAEPVFSGLLMKRVSNTTYLSLVPFSNFNCISRQEESRVNYRGLYMKNKTEIVLVPEETNIKELTLSNTTENVYHTKDNEIGVLYTERNKSNFTDRVSANSLYIFDTLTLERVY